MEEVAVEVEVAAAAAVEVLAQLVAAVGAAAEAPGGDRRSDPRYPRIHERSITTITAIIIITIPRHSFALVLSLATFSSKAFCNLFLSPAVPEGVVVFEASLRILFEVERRSRTRRRHPSTL